MAHDGDSDVSRNWCTQNKNWDSKEELNHLNYYTFKISLNI